MQSDTLKRHENGCSLAVNCMKGVLSVYTEILGLASGYTMYRSLSKTRHTEILQKPSCQEVHLQDTGTRHEYE